MQAFVALMTPKFHDSKWTDQEVGYALARGVPLIGAKMGLNPYGFIGKFQALPCSWDDAPLSIVKLLIRQPAMLDAYINAVGRCATFDDGNLLSKALPSIRSLTDKQVESLVSIFDCNLQVQGSYGFSGSWISMHGKGLAHHLERITRKKYVIRRVSPDSSILRIERRD